MFRAVIDDSVLHRNNKTTFELFWRIDIVEKKNKGDLVTREELAMHAIILFDQF